MDIESILIMLLVIESLEFLFQNLGMFISCGFTLCRISFFSPPGYVNLNAPILPLVSQ